MGNLQFAGGIVSLLCPQGRIGVGCPGMGGIRGPCHHPTQAGAQVSCDTEEVFGQMSYIKWQVINSR